MNIELNKLFEIIGMLVFYSIGVLGTITLILIAWGYWIEWIWQEGKKLYGANIQDYFNWLQSGKPREKKGVSS